MEVIGINQWSLILLKELELSVLFKQKLFVNLKCKHIVRNSSNKIKDVKSDPAA